MSPTSLTLDAGALVALERGDARVRALLQRAVEHELAIDVPAGVVAQVWRDGSRQVIIARLLGARQVQVVALDEPTAKAVGVVCGRTGHADVIDVHVALHARRRGHAVVTSDAGDLRRVDPVLRLIEV